MVAHKIQCHRLIVVVVVVVRIVGMVLVVPVFQWKRIYHPHHTNQATIGQSNIQVVMFSRLTIVFVALHQIHLRTNCPTISEWSVTQLTKLKQNMKRRWGERERERERYVEKKLWLTPTKKKWQSSVARVLEVLVTIVFRHHRMFDAVHWKHKDHHSHHHHHVLINVNILLNTLSDYSINGDRCAVGGSEDEKKNPNQN